MRQELNLSHEGGAISHSLKPCQSIRVPWPFTSFVPMELMTWTMCALQGLQVHNGDPGVEETCLGAVGVW